MDAVGVCVPESMVPAVILRISSSGLRRREMSKFEDCSVIGDAAEGRVSHKRCSGVMRGSVVESRTELVGNLGRVVAETRHRKVPIEMAVGMMQLLVMPSVR